MKGALADAWESADLTGSFGAGLGRWSEADIAAFLETGHGGGVIAFGSMKEAVEKSTQYMTDGDLHAIAVYLKSFPEKKDETAYAPGRASITNEAALRNQNLSELPGAGLYDSACARCHQQDGSGQMPRFPALTGNPVVMSEDPTSLIRIVLEGGPTPKTEIGPAIEKMPAFATLTDREIAEAVSYIRQSWGNQAPPVSTRQVELARTAAQKSEGIKKME